MVMASVVSGDSPSPFSLLNAGIEHFCSHDPAVFREIEASTFEGAIKTHRAEGPRADNYPLPSDTGE